MATDDGIAVENASYGEAEGVHTDVTMSPCFESAPSMYFSARIQSLSEKWNDFESELDFDIEASKFHWTQLHSEDDSESDSNNLEVSKCHWTELNADDEDEQPPNSVVFEELKEHPEWGPFFRRVPLELEIGAKIGEGGQAEIFEAFHNDHYVNKTVVLKVFKKGTFLHDLQRSWPAGLASAALSRRPLPLKTCTGTYGLCWALGALILEDDRFAFIYDKYSGDLRKLIDKKMMKSNGAPPFSSQETHTLLTSIAQGMVILHKLGLLHNDLKASNILLRTFNIQGSGVCIADFESSVGIAGTGFWRAPEILLALKTRTLKCETFTQQTDVYSFAMTCYEVITGCIPFEGHSLNNYELILRGERPVLPDDTHPALKTLLWKCWHHEPQHRPLFVEIVEDLHKLAM